MTEPVDLFAGLPLDPPMGKATAKSGPGPEMPECGHTNWYTAAENEAARAAGHCCRGGQQKVVPCFRSLRGKYRRPVPVTSRRTVEKERTGGFPGLCCDDGGYYIGGVGNDCLRWRPEGTSPCRAHRPDQEEPAPKKPARGKTQSERSVLGH